MSKIPFMPLWVGDFLAKTGDLDSKETGAYMLLLMTMWTHGGSLPDDQKKLQRIARVGRDWPKVWGAIAHYFQAKDGRIFNKRLTEEYDRVRAKSEVNSHAGARGGRAKALKRKEQVVANATDSLKQSEPESELEAVTKVTAATARADDASKNEPRVKLLAAMGVGPDGIAGPSKFIGTAVDMAEAEQWQKMGLPILKQCEIIAEVCRRQRTKDPGWKPARFKYFTAAMSEVVRAKATPVESQSAAQIEKWKRMASG